MSNIDIPERYHGIIYMLFSGVLVFVDLLSYLGCVLKKGVKSAIVIFCSLLILINPYALVFAENQADTGQIAAEKTSVRKSAGIECLFPAHLQRDVFFEGELSEENITYLKNIPHDEALKSLNVLRGDKRGNLMLDKVAERVEGAAMLVRLFRC